MKITVDIPENYVEYLRRLHIPEEHCGPSAEDRLVFLIDLLLLDFRFEREMKRKEELYRVLLGKPDIVGREDDNDMHL